MKIDGLLGCVLLSAVFGAGCATPEARIKRSPEVYASLAVADQQLIREGKVALGFSVEMVKLALGDADRVVTRTDATGVSEVWSYTTYETEQGDYLYRGFYHRHAGWADAGFPYYLSYPARRQREYFKVTFSGGRVSSIEQEK